MIVKKYLHPLKVRQIDTLILGCTHYPLLKSIIGHKIGKRVNIIDSSMAVAQDVKHFIESTPAIDRLLSKNGAADFFVSDITRQFQITSRAVIKRDIRLTRVDL